MAEMRKCPYCDGKNYSANHSEIWSCAYCLKDFHKEESTKT